MNKVETLTQRFQQKNSERRGPPTGCEQVLLLIMSVLLHREARRNAEYDQFRIFTFCPRSDFETGRPFQVIKVTETAWINNSWANVCFIELLESLILLSLPQIWKELSRLFAKPSSRNVPLCAYLSLVSTMSSLTAGQRTLRNDRNLCG